MDESISESRVKECWDANAESWAAGFVLQRIGEPRVSEEACRRHASFRCWRDHAPLFLYLKAAKPR